MFECEGKYTTAKLYAETVEEDLFPQIYDVVNSKAFEGRKVVIMPDAHVGASGPCGMCAEIGDWICPEHVGVDIGCTVSAMMLDDKIPSDLYAEIEHKIKKAIPMGANIHETSIFHRAGSPFTYYLSEKDFYRFLTNGFNRYRQTWYEMLSDLPDKVDEKWVSAQLKRLNMDEGVFYKSLGTIGGGNHFIEYDELDPAYNKEYGKDVSGAIVMHFGSRNFGVKICKYWTAQTKDPLSKEEIKVLTNEFKERYRATHDNMRDVSDALKSYLEEEKSKYVPGYLTGGKMKGYLMDMCFGQLYAEYNHKIVQTLIDRILWKYDIGVDRIISSTHNFIDLEDHILRKSAIRSYVDEEMIVPFNMRDGIAICEGLSNPEWLNSCAHGAGRRLSRSEAKRKLSMDEFKDTMRNIYSTTVSINTLDESPMAYKDTEEIKRLISETCKIKFMMLPKISIKSDEEPLESWKK